MKRKKWSELEEEALLSKYSELLNLGTLVKLKTREKKFKPIAEHINAIHHLQDPITYPFKWSWRDVSIKVQNMRHQYLGVKQKIRASDGEFNWKDGENHWENFLKYKQVFGDVELELKDNSKRVVPGGVCDGQLFDAYGLGLDIDLEGFDEDEENVSGSSGGEDLGSDEAKKMKRRRLSLVGGQLLELRDSMARREEGYLTREGESMSREDDWIEKEHLREMRRRDAEEGLEMRELELEEMQIMWARRDNDRLSRLERELKEERQWRMHMEEKREEEELQWRERLVSMQIEHEKQMVQMQANACQNQLQVLGVMTRFMCQFFGSTSDGLSALPPQIMQNLQHPGGLGDNGKPDSNSPSEFL